MQEWTIWPPWKGVRPKGHKGSNPFPTAPILYGILVSWKFGRVDDYASLES